MASTAPEQDTKKAAALYVGIDVSKKSWVVAMTDGSPKAETGGPRIAVVSVGPFNMKQLAEEINKRKRRFGLPEDAPVVCCYEAGPEGFSVHRALIQIPGLTDCVVDPSSIQMDRRAKQKKTDKLDAKSLVMLLIQWKAGNLQALRVVAVPSEEIEDARRPHRERDHLLGELNRLQNRMGSLLITCGVTGKQLKEAIKGKLAIQEIKAWDGQPLRPHLVEELLRLQECLDLLNKQVKDLEKSMELPGTTPVEQQMLKQEKLLLQIVGVGPVTARIVVREACWRPFTNGKQVGAYAGLAPTPHASGGSQREQGISKAGNPLLRKVLTEIAWTWPRNQEESELARKFAGKMGRTSASRIKRTANVALARQLLVRLWRYAMGGHLPHDWKLKEQ